MVHPWADFNELDTHHYPAYLTGVGRFVNGYKVFMPYPNMFAAPNIKTGGSDDYAEITSRVPSAYIFLAAGFPDEEPGKSHTPTVRFNEDVLPFGSAALANCAFEWLKENN